MRMIFNHLLMRILNLAAKRLVAITQLRKIIHKWAHSREDRSRLVKQARNIKDVLVQNQDVVSNVLEALEESKPDNLTDEHNGLVESIQKSFRWALNGYKAMMEYADEVGFPSDVLEELQKEQSSKS